MDGLHCWDLVSPDSPGFPYLKLVRPGSAALADHLSVDLRRPVQKYLLLDDLLQSQGLLEVPLGVAFESLADRIGPDARQRLAAHSARNCWQDLQDFLEDWQCFPGLEVTSWSEPPVQGPLRLARLGPRIPGSQGSVVLQDLESSWPGP